MLDHMTSMNQSATLMVVTLLAYVVRPSFSMCETRCEQSIPSLNRLRAYWSRSFKRIGENHVTFEQFLLSLVQQTETDDEIVKQLRSSLLRIIGRYQDCVMACEHQFSKRNHRTKRRGPILRALCAKDCCCFKTKSHPQTSTAQASCTAHSTNQTRQ